MSLCVDHFPRGDTWKLGINKNSRPGVPIILFLCSWLLSTFADHSYFVHSGLEFLFYLAFGFVFVVRVLRLCGLCLFSFWILLRCYTHPLYTVSHFCHVRKVLGSTSDSHTLYRRHTNYTRRSGRHPGHPGYCVGWSSTRRRLHLQGKGEGVTLLQFLIAIWPSFPFSRNGVTIECLSQPILLASYFTDNNWQIVFGWKNKKGLLTKMFGCRYTGAMASSKEEHFPECTFTTMSTKTMSAHLRKPPITKIREFYKI